MASWNGDGELYGFDDVSAVNGQVNPSAYLLASPGTVDLEGITRLQYSLSGYSTYNRIGLNFASITFTASDVSSNPGKRLGVSLFIAPESAFAPDVVPTPAQMIALGPQLQVYRSATSTAVAGTFNFPVQGPPASLLTPGTKYWVLAMPVAFTAGTPANYANDECVTFGAENTLGRAVSLFTNQTPPAPTITSPAMGTSVAAGADITLTITTADPDEISGGGDDTTYLDLAGVHVQYAARPTVAEPNPTWIDLPISNFAATDTEDGWYIEGAASNGGAAGLRNDQTMTIRCGSNTLSSLKGVLPGGDWQLRVRVFDYGHPAPALFNPLGNAAGAYNQNTYPASNTSPWSSPVNVSVAAQVPPPIPLSPINNNAVIEGDPITLTWQYRNTAFPTPFAQAKRSLRIRRVGDANWTTLETDEVSASASYTLDPYVPEVPAEVLYSQGWEDAGLGVDGWSSSVGQSVQRITTDAHTGVACLEHVGPFSGGSFFRTGVNAIPVTAGVNYTIDGWLKMPPFDVDDLGVGVRWYNSSMVQIDVFTSVFTATGAWQEVEHTHVAPALSAYAELIFSGTSGSDEPLLDDVTFTQAAIPASGFDQSATHQYEWQVQVEDSDGEDSNWSASGFFFIVPAPASGEVRPLPSSTIDGATLGCGTHRAFIYKRGGLVKVGELTGITYLDWGRVRDDISTAKVKVRDWNVDCGNLLSLIEPWAYELVIWRENGFKADRVWEGPITLPTFKTDEVILDAKDVMAYEYRRIIKQAMGSVDESVVARAARVVQNTLAPDDPNLLAYLQILTRTDDRTAKYRSIPAHSRTAFEEIDDMASNAGLDYCAVGRSILLWGTRHRIGTLPEFRDSDLGESPIVSIYGMSMATGYEVSDGNGIFGRATRGSGTDGIDPEYGLIEMLSSTWADEAANDSGVYSAADPVAMAAKFADYADSSIADRFGPPVVVRVPDNTTLNPDAVVSIQHLVPGVVIPLRSTATLRTVVADQKLDRVKVVETEGKETISITLSPFSDDDSSIEQTEEA